jgi:hypothetical protein
MNPKDILNRLSQVRGRGESWTARCPAHDDKSPSLAIRFKPDGRVLMHCFGGCAVDDVLGAIGLDINDLFDDGPVQRGDQVKPAFYATDLLRIISVESLIVALSAIDMSNGKPLSPDDLERLKLAAERILEATRYA